MERSIRQLVMQHPEMRRHIQSLEAQVASLQKELHAAKASFRPPAAPSAVVELEQVVQSVIDTGVQLVGAHFGAFFYSSRNSSGQQLMLYALSGAPREAFSKYPIPGRTALFGPTFDGGAIIRSDDILRDPRYGHSAPHYGMPAGHLPVRSYLAAPIVSPAKEVLGGLFFGHPDPGVFTERAERVVAGIAQIAAIALENAGLLQAVQHSERRFKALTENSSDGIVVSDEPGVIRYISPAGLSILGYGVDEIVGRHAMDFMHPDDVPALQEFFQRVLNNPAEKVLALSRHKHRDGRWLWLEGVTTNLLHDPAIAGVVSNFRDITERKRTEEALVRSQKMEALGTLAGGIAHDFNNLLLAIGGNTKLAAEDLDPAHPAQQSLAQIAKASHRATDLVGRILAFSRQQEPRRENIELQPIVDDALQLLRATLPAMIAINATHQTDVPAVYADSSQIHQVIMNLMTNAAHAIGNGPGAVDVVVDAVTIQSELPIVRELRPGRYAHIAISDDGCGMNSETIARVFDPFFTTKGAGQGTGLGLSVVHGIVKSHDGAITVYSQLGKGSSFHIYLPAAIGAARLSNEPQAATQRGRGERVLYIDDDSAIVFLTGRILERLGYRVTGCDNPTDGMRAFREAPGSFDVVVTDLSMPGMSGFDIARELRLIRSDVPILMTSGYVRPEDRETARSLGILDLILKPNSVQELGASLDRLFRQMRAPAD
jgi:PAS domain S-box-containing protein